MKKNRPRIRNFCIIAHIDHGKSTLSDRLIERSLLLADRDKREQILDDMDIERERGITIKSHAITIPYESAAGGTYFLNFVDTPGHVDFSYEVSRAISSCEGALLLIDATQGPQAQTVSNMYMALEHDLEIIPVINKIDLPSARVEEVKHEIEHDLGLLGDDAVLVSAKTGEGIDALLEKIIELVPPPRGEPDKPLQALIFDSHYDTYRGVIIHIRIFDGEVKAGDELRFMSNKAAYKAEEVGIFVLALKKQEKLSAGDVGYIIAGIKTVSDINIGDTITTVQKPCEKPLEGFRLVKPVVFSSIYPVDANDYEELQSALEKLKLNDSSLVYEKDSSAALGFGYRCGFLGLLHLEVVQERLEREYDLSLVLTSPSVKYRITLNKGEQVEIDNPLEFPDPGAIACAEEPYIKATVITPDEFLGNVINLCMEKRGVQQGLTYLDQKRVELIYDMPLAEVLFDFYDRLKSTSKGYASFDYEVIGYKESSLVKLDILVNGESVDALSQLVFRDNAYEHARRICRKLKEEIPRHQFKIAIQGSIGSSIIARETVSPLRKDVTAKCYGGDISRKRKLIEKQKEGKKRMKMVGNVELPQSAFLSVLKSEDS
jgi:GTP-binding protein LepA